MAEYDLVVRGGTVADGTGNRHARGGCRDPRTARSPRFGAVSARGAEEIAAKGLLVTPGFVDVHTHYDGQGDLGLAPAAFGLARRHNGGHGQLRRRLRAGEDRGSPAALIELMEGVEDIPGAARSTKG